MRPGRFHPGNFQKDDLRFVRDIISFNEAGAFPPRKSKPIASSPRKRSRRFNEAGAFPPRKCRSG